MTFGLKEDALEIWSAKASDLPDEEGTDLQLAGDEIGEVPVAKSDRAGTLGSDAVLSVERAAPHLGVAASPLGGWAGIMRAHWAWPIRTGRTGPRWTFQRARWHTALSARAIGDGSPL